MKLKEVLLAAGAAAFFILAMPVPAQADPFTKADLARWDEGYLSVVKQGRDLFTDSKLGTNGVVCAQCHPNAANTHPETYPKYQKQVGRVVQLWEVANWCIENPLEGKALTADDPKMVALITYITHERRGVALSPGKH